VVQDSDPAKSQKAALACCATNPIKDLDSSLRWNDGSPVAQDSDPAKNQSAALACCATNPTKDLDSSLRWNDG